MGQAQPYERIDDQTKQLRQLVWDEENRLSRSFDQGKETIYRYDDAGTRIVKRGKYGEISYVDPTFSIREAEVASKHIFAGNSRIATKLVMLENRTGTGKVTYVRPDGVNGHSDTLPEKSRGEHTGQEKQLDPLLQQQVNEHAWQQRERRTSAAHGKGHDKVRGNDATALPGRSENGLENALRNGDGNKYGIYRRLDRLGYEITVDHRIVPQGSTTPSDPLDPIFTGPTVPEEHQIYYYHGDHLGSSTVISDRFGRNYEHLQYFPYGETWVEEARSQTNLPYKFTGKELDPETGLYYFGARYYEPRTSVWESADPILGKYLPIGDDGKDRKLPGNGGVFNSLNLGLYTYAHLNPVVLIDPDGRAPREYPTLYCHVNEHFDSRENFIGGVALVAAPLLAASPEIALAIGARYPAATVFATEIVAGMAGYSVSVWNQPSVVRGNIIEQILGGNLPRNFPTIDRVIGGIATSIKSINLRDQSYLKPQNLLSTLKGYINKLDDFSGASSGGVRINEGIDFVSKSLEVAIPKGSASPQQIEALKSAAEYAAKKEITLKIIEIP